MGVRRWAPISALLAGLAAVGIIWISQDRIRTDGPLAAPSSMDIEFSLLPGETASWGILLPYNLTDEDFTIEEVDPLNVEGLEILGVVATDPADGTIVNAFGFPPEGFRTRPIHGAAIRPRADTAEEFQIIVGVRLVEDSPRGSIDLVRLRYRDSSGQRYEVELPWSLQVTAATS